MTRSLSSPKVVERNQTAPSDSYTWPRSRSRSTARATQPSSCSRASLGVRFDVWTSEARLHDEGWVARAVDRLRERGHVYEEDGAVWFRSTAFGDDKD